VTIQRPARVLPSYRTGASNPNDLFTRLLVGCVQLGSLPSTLGGNEYGAPVDHVASASVALGLTAQVQSEYGSIWHLFERRPISPGALLAVTTVDYGLGIAEHATWINLLGQSKSNVLRPLVHEVREAVPVDFLPSFDSTLTEDALSNHRCSLGPSLDYQHCRQQLTFLRRLRMLPEVSTTLPDGWLLSTLSGMHEAEMAVRTPLQSLPSASAETECICTVPPALEEIECISMACDDDQCNFRPVHSYRRPVGEWDVHISVQYCGVCHSDLTVAGAQQALPVQYPIVPGHEAVGICIKVGASVTRFKVGDHIGVGNMVDSCLQCRSCLEGEEQWCSWMVGTFNGRDWSGRAATGAGVPYTLGGYSTSMVVHERFCIQIPLDYPLEHAGPVMCAGTTMYDPLKRAGAGVGTRLGIVGLGGLGTTGLKLGKALGCSVTVISRGESKRAQALRLGADQYIATSDAGQLGLHAGSLDLIINTIPAKHDPSGFSTLLSQYGKQVLVGINAAAIAALAKDLLWMGDSKETMSYIGGVATTQEVMDLCARDNILTEIEVRPVSDLNRIFEALDRTNESGKRFVLDIAGSLDTQISTSPQTQLAPAPRTDDVLKEYAEALGGFVEMLRCQSSPNGIEDTAAEARAERLADAGSGRVAPCQLSGTNADEVAAATIELVQRVAEVLDGGLRVQNGPHQQASVQLRMTSEGPGGSDPLSWHMDFAADGTASVREGQSPKPDATITTTYETLQGVAAGRTGVAQAYWSGQLQVEGSVSAARQVGAVLAECKRHVDSKASLLLPAKEAPASGLTPLRQSRSLSIAAAITGVLLLSLAPRVAGLLRRR